MSILILFICFFFDFSKKKIRSYKILFLFFYFNSIPRVLTPILRIPDPFPTLTTFPISQPDSRIPFFIPCIPTPIPRISLIPFPDSPFQLLQIAYCFRRMPNFLRLFATMILSWHTRVICFGLHIFQFTWLLL